MKKILFIISLFFSVAAIGQTDEYYRTVDWKFYPDSIVQLTDSTYQLVAIPFDYNDKGAINRNVGNYVVDFVGHRFKVIDSTATKITVLDIYHTGQAPQSLQLARCYRSVGNGEAEYVGSVDYSPLDESARWKLNGSDNELLWRKIQSKKLVDLFDVDTTYIPLTTTGQIPVWNNDSSYFDFTYNPLVQHEITHEPSGFEHPEDVIVSYNSTNRTITLTGNTTAFWKGDTINELVSGWTSDSHTATTGVWYLYYNGTSFVWSQDPWTFDMVQIAFVNYNVFAIREPHGLMQYQTHKELHETIGTYLTAGGDISDYVLKSTTAADRRPLVSATSLMDEDNKSLEPALTTESYTRYYLSSTNTGNYALASNDIVALSGNQPYYNQWNGSAWVQTLMSTTAYQAIWLVAIPVTADTQSQAYRYLWVQGQRESTTLSTIQAVSPSDVSLGNLQSLTPEVLFIGKVIIRYIGGNWQIISVEKLTGNKLNQTTLPAGNYLSIVYANAPISGNGTVSDPLTIDTTSITGLATQYDLTQISTSGVTGSGTANQVAYWNGTGSITGNARLTIANNGEEILTKSSSSTTSRQTGIRMFNSSGSESFRIGHDDAANQNHIYSNNTTYPINIGFGVVNDANVRAQFSTSGLRLTDGTLTGATVNEFSTDGTFAGNSDTAVPTEKAVKTYVSNNSGTVTSVGLTAPIGFSVSGSPVTSSGTLALSFASGYSLPTTASQLLWDGAYTHSTTTTGSVHGSTTVGGSFLRLTNPSAITFPRINADNTVTALSAANFTTAIGAVPTSRTLTINGTSYDLSADRSWTISAGVSASGTPLDNQLSVWTNATTIEGDADLTFDGTNLTVGGYITDDAVRVQSLSGTTVTMNTQSGMKAAITLTGNTTLTISNLQDGQEGLIEVTNGSSVYTLNINGSTGYTTEKVMGSKAAINANASTHTTVIYWRTGSTLYYGFLYDN